MDTDLNRFIAEKVFGLVPCRGSHAAVTSWPCYADPKSPDRGRPLLTYSNDISLAFEAADKAKLFSSDLVSLIHNEEGLWEVRVIDYQGGDWDTMSTAETIPLVICRAIHFEMTQPEPKPTPAVTVIPRITGNFFAGKPLTEHLRTMPKGYVTGAVWAVCTGGRVAHAWRSHIDHSINHFIALCDASLKYTGNPGSKKCVKCERLAK